MCHLSHAHDCDSRILRPSSDEQTSPVVQWQNSTLSTLVVKSMASVAFWTPYIFTHRLGLRVGAFESEAAAEVKALGIPTWKGKHKKSRGSCRTKLFVQSSRTFGKSFAFCFPNLLAPASHFHFAFYIRLESIKCQRSEHSWL